MVRRSPWPAARGRPALARPHPAGMVAWLLMRNLAHPPDWPSAWMAHSMLPTRAYTACGGSTHRPPTAPPRTSTSRPWPEAGRTAANQPWRVAMALRPQPRFSPVRLASGLDPSGYVWIADGRRGLRVVGPDGVIRSVASTAGPSTVDSVVADGGGNVYVSTTSPDYLVSIDPLLQPCGGPVLVPGSLVELIGTQEVQILDNNCKRRYVSNAATLDAIEQTYHVRGVATASARRMAAPGAGTRHSRRDPRPNRL